MAEVPHPAHGKGASPQGHPGLWRVLCAQCAPSSRMGALLNRGLFVGAAGGLDGCLRPGIFSEA